MTEPSKLFEQVFCEGGYGSPSIECGCGRTCFSDSPDHPDGELDSLKELMKEKPKRYVHMEGDDFVSAVEIAGQTVVQGCPCDFLAKLEQMIWWERERLVKYIRARAVNELGQLRDRAEAHKRLLFDTLPVYDEADPVVAQPEPAGG